jgi:insertion element IS1 protein InsB
LSETLVKPDADGPEATTMDLDGLWSFVYKKKNKVWIWIALCRKTRQVVSRAIGDRSKETGAKLLMWSAGIIRSGNASAVLFDKLFLSLSLH